jgi:hypothetical protein
MIKKVIEALLLILVVVAVLGCSSPEPEEFDDAALLAVTGYVDEMTAALLDKTLEADLKGWVREHYGDELPLCYDEERRGWLGEHAANLESIRSRHLQGSNFPAAEDIATWQVVVVRGDAEWMLHGDEVLDGLEKLDQLYFDLTGTVEMIDESGGELDMEQSEKVLQLLEEIATRVEEVRAVFYR